MPHSCETSKLPSYYKSTSLMEQINNGLYKTAVYAHDNGDIRKLTNFAYISPSC